MTDLFKHILENIKVDNFDNSPDYRNEIYDKLTEIDESFTFSKEDLLIDLDPKNNKVESYINFSFDNYIRIYPETHEDEGSEIKINEVVLGGLTISLLDWQGEKVKGVIDNILVFA